MLVSTSVVTAGRVDAAGFRTPITRPPPGRLLAGSSAHAKRDHLRRLGRRGAFRLLGGCFGGGARALPASRRSVRVGWWSGSLLGVRVAARGGGARRVARGRGRR